MADNISNITDFKKSFEYVNSGFILEVPAAGSSPLCIRVRKISGFEVSALTSIGDVMNDIIPGNKSDKTIDMEKYVDGIKKQVDVVLDKIILEPAYGDIKDYLMMEQKQFIIDNCVINDVKDIDKFVIEDIKKN